MVTQAQNERLTRSGPGTDLGNLLRRYWQPIAAASQLDAAGVLRIKLLGEELNLFRDGQGRLGLVAQRCAHRCYDLKYGIPEERGLRCAYHGWLYDVKGQCIEQPAEPKGSKLKDRIKILSYPVEELAGLIFAYLGPDPAPELPRWEWMTRQNCYRAIGSHITKANWLQNVENAPDLDHAPWLHGTYYTYLLKKQGIIDPDDTRLKLSTGFNRPFIRSRYDPYEMGQVSRAYWEGDDENHVLWKIGQTLLFPGISCVSTRHAGLLHMFMQWRVPVDDYTTNTITLHNYDPGADFELPQQQSVPYFPVVVRELDGDMTIDAIQAQDTRCMEAQGAIMDRTQENLGYSDRGIVLFRKTLVEQMDKVAFGEDPMNVFRTREAASDLPIGVCDTRDGQTAFGADAREEYVRGMSTVGMVFGPAAEEIEDLATRAAEVWQKRGGSTVDA